MRYLVTLQDEVIRQKTMKEGSEKKATLLDERRFSGTRLNKLQRLEAELQQAREVLRASEAKYRELVETASSIILRMDTKGYITFSNPFAQNFFGYGKDELLGQHVVGTVVPEIDSSGRDLAAMMKDICECPEKYSKNENENICRNGERGWVAWINKSVLDSKGRLNEILCIGNDITQRKKAEERLLVYQEQLRSLASELSLIEERERRRIATHLHDGIGQILAIAKLKIETLREAASKKTSIAALDEIRGLIEQAIHDTRTLTLDLSPPVLYELGFEAVVEWLLERIQEQHGIRSRFENDKEKKPMDEDIRIVLFQAVRELLINVTKHARTKRVKVSIRRRDGIVEIKVKDWGVGFNVFEAYSCNSKTGGFGLFSIRERLSHLGGRVIVESQPGKGTEVTLLAPLKCLDEKTEEGITWA